MLDSNRLSSDTARPQQAKNVAAKEIEEKFPEVKVVAISKPSSDKKNSNPPAT